MREWLTRLHDWLRRERLDAELTEELRFHRQHLERDAVAAGLSPREARDAARRRLGSEQRVKEAARTRWSVPWLDRLGRDVRYAGRGLRRAPLFTLTVVLTLGLGVGANAAMFDVVDHLMYRPFPYLRDPGAVHRVYLQTTVRGRVVTNSVVPYTRYVDLVHEATTIAASAAVAQRPLAVGVGEGAREREVAGVSASLFAFFDARPVRGRFFGASEDVAPRGAPVVVLSYRFWRDALGGADVVGRTLHVGTVPCTIVGVAPAGFVGFAGGAPPDVFLPITTFPRAAGENKVDSYATLYNWDWVSILVRRRPNVTADAASADLSRAYVLSRRAQRVQNPGMIPESLARARAIAGAARPAGGPDAGLESRTLLWTTGVAALVLVIACANVMNLMFARTLRRRGETALRLALGVGRRRLVAQALVEGTLIALLGGVAGVLVAQWGGAALRTLVLRDALPTGAILDGRVLAVAACVALGAGIVTTVIPAALGAGDALAPTIRAGGRGGGVQRSRLRAALLVAQGALSVLLLVGAALFVRSFEHVRRLRLGYDAESVLVVMPNYRGVVMDSAQRVAFRRRLLAAAQAIPGVRAAARVNSRPFGSNTRPLFVDGIDSVAPLGRFNFQLGTADLFRTLGTRIVRGRAFGAGDREGAPGVAVVSASMARALWPGRDALGQCLRVDAESAPCLTVVGIAEDAAEHSLTDASRFVYYLPLDQHDPAGGNSLYVRVARDEIAARGEEVRRALRRTMPGDGYVTVQPMQALVDAQRRSWQLGALAFTAFGALALVVAAVGLYGVIAYTVAQRTHELGVRMALGARGRDVVRLVVGQGIAFALAGVALGLSAAGVAARWVEPLLFRQSATDPLVYAAVAAAMLVVGALASALPARRATRTNPTIALRAG